ncbi:MAG: DNA repair protein RecN, partial [Eubacteriales bacterium]|nr:DNA repair protein RecN [Eubacteriales bacterium]
MLLSLHVKNLALIAEEEVTFTDGLNILTGETGAGKSFIIGSVNLALGAKADPGLIREGAEYALIELVFSVDNEGQRGALAAMELEPEEDGTILIKRRIYAGRSVCTVSGETVTARQLREIAELLIDVCGQRENQTLLRRERQLGLLDEYAGRRAQEVKSRLKERWRTLREVTAQWEDAADESARMREAELLRYEIGELEQADIRDGEDEELEGRYRRLSSFQRIHEAAGIALACTAGEEGGASEQIARACRELRPLAGCDGELDELIGQLEELDGLLSDFDRALSDYAEGLTFDPGEFVRVEERLNLVNRLKDKYGVSGAGELGTALAQRRERFEAILQYEERREELAARREEEREKALILCRELSALRREAAGELSAQMKQALLELNFEQVEFEITLSGDPEAVGENGTDRALFLISMNPGEPLRPLDQIASGGELSRMMLALKTVFAGRDGIRTLVFDEIDSGISGQTAWKVAQKLGVLAGNHQILCITHLPQIAAMEDSHFLIRKQSSDG